MNNAKINNDNLWIYAIHSNSAEIIHFLEDNQISIDDQSMEKDYLESIKCHHNQIADYIKDNKLNRKIDIVNDINVKNEEIISTILKYHNYLYLPEDFENNYGFFYLCKYEYLELIELFLNTKKIKTEISDQSLKELANENKIYIVYYILGKRTQIKKKEFEECQMIRFSIPPTIKTICDYSFNGCSSLTQITIPSSVTSIGNNAFRGCSSLTQITIPSSVTKIGNYAFSRCSSLTQIAIPSSVTSIGDDAFFGCSSLTQITILSSITSIRNNAFSRCSNLTQITIYEDIYLEEYSFIEELAYFINNLDDTTVYIADLPINNVYPPSCAIDENFIRNFLQDYGFNCDSVKINIAIGENTKPCAFASIKFKTHDEAKKATNDLNYTKFDGVPIRLITKKEEGKNIILNYSTNCIIIKNLDREIEAYQIHDEFAKYGEIISCKMPISFDNEKNKYLSQGYCFVCFQNPEDAKQAMNDLKDATINGKQIEIEPISISIKEINYKNFIKECSLSTQTTIPSSVTKIGDSVFSRCSSLTQITIPSSVTSIGNSAFNGCSSLTQITIPSSVTSIGDSAFNGCSSLAQITIPASVTSIEDYAFNGCSSLTQITIPASVTSIGNFAFYKCSSLTQITIPFSVKKNWRFCF